MNLAEAGPAERARDGHRGLGGPRASSRSRGARTSRQFTCTMKSETDTSRRPPSCLPERRPGRVLDDVVGQRQGRGDTNCPRCSGAEVELVALLVLDRTGSVPDGSDRTRCTRHRPRVPPLEALDQGVLAVGVGLDKRRGSCGHVRRRPSTPRAHAAPGRLHDHAAAEAPMTCSIRCSHRCRGTSRRRVRRSRAPDAGAA